MYELHVKSHICTINVEALNAILISFGYNANIDGGYNIIEFNDLKSVQKTEEELRQKFTCFVIERDDNLNQVRIIKVKSFKESGKWYDEFDVKLPYDINEWDIPSYIQTQKDYLNFILYGHYANNVPFLVLSNKDI